MRAYVFYGGRVTDVERPRAGTGEAVIRVTLTTICGTDLHIVKGEYQIKPGLVIGHEPVGVIEELGPGVEGYRIGARRRRDAVRPMSRLPVGATGAVRPW